MAPRKQCGAEIELQATSIFARGTLAPIRLKTLSFLSWVVPHSARVNNWYVWEICNYSPHVKKGYFCEVTRYGIRFFWFVFSPATLTFLCNLAPVTGRRNVRFCQVIPKRQSKSTFSPEGLLSAGKRSQHSGPNVGNAAVSGPEPGSR